MPAEHPSFMFHLPPERPVEVNQRKEPSLPEIAKEVHEMADFVRQGLRTTPEVAIGMVEQYTAPNARNDSSKVLYKKGESQYSVDLNTIGQRDRPIELLRFEKSTKNPDGGYDTWVMDAENVYEKGEPQTGKIFVKNEAGEKMGRYTYKPTADALQEAWRFFRSEYGEPQSQTPQQK